MLPTLTRFAALALASGLAASLIYVCLALADGWASRAAIGRGAVMALVGIGLALPVAVAFEALAPGLSASCPPAAIRAFLSAALPEEGGRLIVLFLLVRAMTTRDPREFFLGVVAAGLAFGLVENLLYLQASKSSALMLGAVRGSLSAPSHLAYALFSGFGVWRFARERAGLGFVAGMTGLAFLLHGCFDFVLMSWPSVKDWNAGAVSGVTLFGLGAALLAVVLAQGLGALAAIDAFVGRIEAAEPHDVALALRPPLSNLWRGLGAGLIALAGLGVAATCAAVVLFPAEMTVKAPVALALAASLAVWGLGVRHMATRQRDNAAEARRSFAFAGQWRRAA